MDAITTWASTHQSTLLLVLTLWPVLTAIVNVLFKPRTPAEYAALPPWLAGVLKFVASMGLDPIGAIDGLGKFLAALVKKAPPGAAVLLVFLLPLCATFATSSPQPAPAPMVMTGCAWLQSPDAKNAETIALDAAEFACVVGELEMPSSQIAQDCGLLQKYGPGVIDVINALIVAQHARDAKVAMDRAIDSGTWWCWSRDAGALDQATPAPKKYGH